MSIGAAFALVIFPPACEMTLLVSELAFATRAMKEDVEQGGSLPVCLSICVQRAALKTPPPFGRTLSFPESAFAPLKRCGLLPPGKLWSPSADSVQSPREWVATAHPLGKHVPQTADKPKETEPNTMFNKVILIGRLGQNAEAKTAQNNREYVVLNIATQENWKNDKGEYEKAIADFTSVIELNPQKARAYGYRGLAELFIGKDAEAAADLAKCYKMDPSLKEMFDKQVDTIRKNRKPEYA